MLKIKSKINVESKMKKNILSKINNKCAYLQVNKV